MTAVFDEPNLVSCAGLVPVLQVAERAGLHALVKDHLHLAEAGGVNGHLKVPALVAGMVAGADSIELCRLRDYADGPRQAVAEALVRRRFPR